MPAATALAYAKAADGSVKQYALLLPVRVFAGVRKLVRCDSTPEPPREGTEVTYSEIIVDTLQAVQDLAAGRRVPLKEYD